jgi:hypothetical protein
MVEATMNAAPSPLTFGHVEIALVAEQVADGQRDGRRAVRVEVVRVEDHVDEDVVHGDLEHREDVARASGRRRDLGAGADDFGALADGHRKRPSR